MDNNQILQAAEPVGAPTQCQAKLCNGFPLIDDHTFMHELRNEVTPASGCPVDNSEAGTDFLKVVGVAELTAANSSRFRKQVRAALNGHATVEIDLSRTTSMDCAGLGTLIAIRNLIGDPNGAVRLVNPTSRVLQLLDLLRAGQIFEIVITSPSVGGAQ
jgi:anti-anti-sigma factor